MSRMLPLPEIDFVGKRRLAYAISIVALVISLASLLLRGLDFGIDFTGGTIVEIGFSRGIEVADVAERLRRAGIGSAGIQHLGTARDLVVRIPPQQKIDQAEIGSRFLAALSSTNDPPPTIRRVEFVGAQVGQELVDKGGIALLIALGGISLYIWLRFERKFAIGALAATLHDPILILGYFSVTGTEFDLSVLAAMLAVVGYSVNDTIVIFDRIRENFRKVRDPSPYELVNLSVNQTLSRSLITSGTTLMVAVAMLLFGGSQLHGFSLALVIGILVGTYSSIYVASTLALALGANRRDLMPGAHAAQDEETPLKQPSSPGLSTDLRAIGPDFSVPGSMALKTQGFDRHIPKPDSTSRWPVGGDNRETHSASAPVLVGAGSIAWPHNGRNEQ